MHLPNNTFLQGGKYKIVRFLSAGGFGCTYEAEHVLLHKRMAIKEFFVKSYCNRDEKKGTVYVGTQSVASIVEKLKRKFIDEAVALSGFNNPHIVRVSDVFEENGTAYYVMDYIDGCSLNEMVKREGRLSEDRAKRYILQVADALRYVHNRNRLHLDIKPGNIMVDRSDNAFLIDFGVSKQYDEVDGENTSTLLGATPGYAPIEQMSNRVQTFHPATDIYSLGATMYNLLSGETPDEPPTILNKGLKELPAEISAKTKKAVYKAMQVKTDKRPQTIDEFVALLGETSQPPIVQTKERHNDKDTKILGSKKMELPQVEPIIAKLKRRLWPKAVLSCLLVAVAVLAMLFVQKCSGRTEDDATETELIQETDSSLTAVDETEDYLTTEQQTIGSINGHEYVDLGLPSGLKWATCNVGASKPEEYGDYFAWG